MHFFKFEKKSFTGLYDNKSSVRFNLIKEYYYTHLIFPSPLVISIFVVRIDRIYI